jgi:hypothetical protein
LLTSADSLTWLEVQNWALYNNWPRSLCIVPTYPFAFRTESERPTCGDWRDGTQMFRNPAFGSKWIRRLGYEDNMGIQGFDNLETLGTPTRPSKRPIL